jgi:hypothetical protein
MGIRIKRVHFSDQLIDDRLYGQSHKKYVHHRREETDGSGVHKKMK